MLSTRISSASTGSRFFVRVSRIRASARSINAIFAKTTSRSTTRHPLEQSLLRCPANAQHVVSSGGYGGYEVRAGHPVALAQQTATPDDLHREDRRTLTHVDEIYRTPQLVFERSPHLHQSVDIDPCAEQDPQVDVGLARRTAGRFRTKQPYRRDILFRAETIDNRLEMVVSCHAGIVAQRGVPNPES